MSSESPDTPGGIAGKRKYLFVTVIVMLIDQVSKYFVSTRMQEGDEFDIIRNFFAISYTKNSGIAFGMFNSGNLRWLFIIISVVAVCIVLVYMTRTSVANRLLLWSLALLAAGICGNLIDRIRIGRVIDFLLVHYKDHWFPVFNVADTAISIGAALMAIELFFAQPPGQTTEPAVVESPEKRQESEVWSLEADKDESGHINAGH